MSVVIKESTYFRDSYYDISDFCHKFQEPVIITRNGVSDLAVMTIETYEEITGIRNLINLLEEADNDIENGNFLTEEEMDKKLELL
jgi:PHD/YefM family antitoxin component YafN of YafNO toxin-antitoxin module